MILIVDVHTGIDGIEVPHGGLEGGDVQHLKAQSGTALHVAVLDDLQNDVVGGIHRNGEAQTLHGLIRHLGVDDTHQLAGHIEEAAARVTGVDGSRDLKQSHDVAADADLAGCGRDHTLGDGAAQGAQGVADGENVLTHHQIKAGAEGGDGQGIAPRVDPQHGNVALLVGANEVSTELGTVAQTDGDGGSTLHHVVVGDDISFLGNDDAAARACRDVLAEVARLGHGLGGDLHHRGGNEVDHRGHRHVGVTRRGQHLTVLVGLDLGNAVAVGILSLRRKLLNGGHRGEHALQRAAGGDDGAGSLLSVAGESTVTLVGVLDGNAVRGALIGIRRGILGGSHGTEVTKREERPHQTADDQQKGRDHRGQSDHDSAVAAGLAVSLHPLGVIDEAVTAVGVGVASPVVGAVGIGVPFGVGLIGRVFHWIKLAHEE